MALSSIPDAPLFKGKSNQQKFEATAEKNKPQQESSENKSSPSATKDNVSVRESRSIRSASDILSAIPSTELDQAAAEEMLQQTIASLLEKSEEALNLHQPNSDNAVQLLQET